MFGITANKMTYREAIEILTDSEKECIDSDFCYRQKNCASCPLAEAMDKAYNALDSLEKIEQIMREWNDKEMLLNGLYKKINEVLMNE